MSEMNSTFVRLRTPFLWCAAAALAGTSLGWLGRGLRDGALPEASLATRESAAAPAAGDNAAGIRILTPGERKADAISRRLVGAKGLNYWLRLLGAAETADVSVLARLSNLLGKEPSALSLLGTRWGQLDVADLFGTLKSRAAKMPGWFENPRVEPGFEDLQEIMISEWFRQNPPALIQALQGTEGMYWMKTARAQLLSHLAATDPEQALRLTIEWKIPLQTEDTAALKTWVRANAGKAVEMMLATERRSLTMGDAREVMMSEAAKVLAGTDPAGALSGFTNLRSSVQREFVFRIVKEWAERDLAATVAWFSDPHLNLVETPVPFEPLMEVWGASDPAAAMDWARHHVREGYQGEAATAIVQAIARHDPARAVDFISQLDPGGAKNDAMRRLANLSVKNKEKPELLAAFQWMMAMPDPSMRDVAMGAAANVIVAAAPEEVTSYLKTPESAEAPLYLLLNAAGVMAQKDGAATMEWAAGLRPEVARQVRQNAFSSWFSRDPAEAGAWLRELPANEERLNIVAEITRSIASQKGEDSLSSWLETLPASDHAAILKGLDNSYQMDPAAKARLAAKYR